jgi:predicted molibdopterin-dependent oxidoreductase YjgC
VKTASPFRELETDVHRVPVRFAGKDLMLRDGGNLAAELLAAGVRFFRHTPSSGAERGPFCMMGACFDCLVEIDGVTRQACMCEVRAGMDIGMPGPEGDGDA